MVKKTCPYCGKDSYSAGDDYKWICPHCKKDITDVEAVPAEVAVFSENEVRFSWGDV